MSGLLAFSKAIDRFTAAVGRGAAWAILAAVLVSAGNAVSRKMFSLSSNAWLELQWYLFGVAFLLTAAWTLRRGEHVRVELIHARLSARRRIWIDLFGHLLFLLPFVVVSTYYLIDYVAKSFKAGEYSSSVGGLILWPAKALLLGGFLLLGLQTLSETVKTIAALRTGRHDGGPAAPPNESTDGEASVRTARMQP